MRYFLKLEQVCCSIFRIRFLKRYSVQKMGSRLIRFFGLQIASTNGMHCKKMFCVHFTAKHSNLHIRDIIHSIIWTSIENSSESIFWFPVDTSMENRKWLALGLFSINMRVTLAADSSSLFFASTKGLI